MVDDFEGIQKKELQRLHRLWYYDSFFYLREERLMREHIERLRAGGVSVDKRPRRRHGVLIGYSIYVR